MEENQNLPKPESPVFDCISQNEDFSTNDIFSSSISETNESYSEFSKDFLSYYKKLPERLSLILSQLDLEIEPVNIREEKTLLGCNVNLSETINSKLCKRRLTLPSRIN